ncbi:type II toxin-antitoxin system RelE/ParE family toxin [Chlorobium sp. KB01]|uniref:type II toxin-antitoxin system RelE/ParE family toxin n=1 Tax=Chlorobium sp. KB01 TaxID=1917528 RepID=UPI0034CE9AD3
MSAAVMLPDLILLPEAQKDISDAYWWYEDRRDGLGEEFLGCLDACIQTICRSPELYPVVHEHYHRALVRRFPYAVFYEQSIQSISVYSIFHTSQDPMKWHSRL